MHPFKHKVPIQIRFKDIDKMGHVNNSNHLTYVEFARIRYFEEVVRTDKSWSKSVGIILARVEVDYKAPIFLHDNVFVYTRCVKIGTKSLTFESMIIREKNGTEEILARVVAVLVCYDYEKETTIEVPQAHRDIVMNYEGLMF